MGRRNPEVLVCGVHMEVLYRRWESAGTEAARIVEKRVSVVKNDQALL
jgi:hypothetical protein